LQSKHEAKNVIKWCEYHSKSEWPTLEWTNIYQVRLDLFPKSSVGVGLHFENETRWDSNDNKTYI